MRRLPPDVRDDLAFASLRVAMARAGISWLVATWVTCSDTTPSPDGIVGASVSRSLAALLYHACDYRGRAAAIGKNTLVSLGSSPNDEPEDSDDLAQYANWQLNDFVLSRILYM